MKKKLLTLALLSTVASSFADPISTPNTVNDNPIISSGGGSTGGSGQCQAYQTNGTAVNLSGGETLMFYGSGYTSAGGYLSTKSTYSGSAYITIASPNNNNNNSAIGLFIQNTTAQSGFIAGAGAAGLDHSSGVPGYSSYYLIGGEGGGWTGKTNTMIVIASYTTFTGSNFTLSSRPGGFPGSYNCGENLWFNRGYYYTGFTPGFCAGFEWAGAASSISAFYNYSTKQYTLPSSSFTVAGGGYGIGPSALYVCK